MRLSRIAVTIALSGCAGYQQYRDAQSAFEQGRPEQGVAKLREAMNAAPGNTEYRRLYFSERETRVESALSDAQRASELGAFDIAREKLERAAIIDPGNTRVAQARARIDVDQPHWKAIESATALAHEDKPGSLDEAIVHTRQVLSEDPQLSPRLVAVASAAAKAGRHLRPPDGRIAEVACHLQDSRLVDLHECLATAGLRIAQAGLWPELHDRARREARHSRDDVCDEQANRGRLAARSFHEPARSNGCWTTTRC